MDAVELQELHHVYPPARRSGFPRTALSGLTFSIPRGDIFGLLGPNGGGKTTLFRILSTALVPTHGKARIFGLDVVSRAADIRGKIGVVFQNPSLDKKLTVGENLVYQGRLHGLWGPALSQRVRELLERFQMADRAGDRVELLSGGLQRRVEIAKGLLHRPELLLLDEPSTGLDPGARRDLWDHLLALKEEGITVLITTHLMEEAEHCDHLAILSEGHRVASGTPAELKSRIGGDVITVHAQDPQPLCERIRAKFGGQPQVVDHAVRLERPQGHAFIPQLVEAFPGEILSVTLGKPTLEDVFIHLTGHGFRIGQERRHE